MTIFNSYFDITRPGKSHAKGSQLSPVDHLKNNTVQEQKNGGFGGIPLKSNGSGFLKPIGSMYAIYGNMDPINISPMFAYIAYMDPMGNGESHFNQRFQY